MTTETLFRPLTQDSATDEQKAILDAVQKSVGFVPNLMATMTNSPTLINGYLALAGVLDKGTFSPVERNILFLSISDQNDCAYCRAAHSTILKSMLKADAATVDAVKAGEVPADAKLAALSAAAREMTSGKGAISASTRSAFLSVGYRDEQLLEILVAIGLKTMSNALDHLSPVAIDPAFQPEA